MLDIVTNIRGLDKIRQQPGWEDFDEAAFYRVFGTEEEMRARAEQSERDRRFLESECVQSKYPGEWVSVIDGQVVGHAADWRELRQMLIENGFWGKHPFTEHVPAR